MVVLLDTHALVWVWTGDKRLSRSTRDLLASDGVVGTVSTASIWELAIKRSIGKFELKLDLDVLVRALPEYGFTTLPVSMEHALAVKQLPFHHRDPFDRMLIAQARTENMHVLTADPHFKSYDVLLMST
ncbi:MAG: type II toxin-antitoxin system VapC family toxin [Flavobacteriales bacterium]|jgi:PIN domain nuclease of toxin-antitoxin system|nr:type II toxin-antitoxin system VapC family toxin [Flavobacteriales bacterium]